MDAYTFVQTDNLKQNQVLEIMSWGKRDKCDDRINFSNSATEKKKKKNTKVTKRNTKIAVYGFHYWKVWFYY